MTIAIAIVGGVLAYPVIAGWAYRLINRDVPPEPRVCDGNGFNGYGSRCKADTGEGFPQINVKYPALYCDACNEWLRWRVRVVVMPKSKAWLWPVIWIPALVNRLFDAGANIEATPAPSPTPRSIPDSLPGKAAARRGQEGAR